MASAVVQMTPFSPCSQLNDMIMIAAEASLESFPGTVSMEDRHKRSQYEGDEDQDRSHVKKRRKQSKPIRITAESMSDGQLIVGQDKRGVSELEFSETGEHFLTEGIPAVHSIPLSSKDDYENLCRLKEETNRVPVYDDNQDKTQNDTVYSSSVPLNLSSSKPTYMDSLVVPNVGEIQTTNKGLESSQTQFQTSDNSKNSIAQDSPFLSHSPSLLLPLFKQSQIQNQMPPISSQMRIFNPEAFCDLCNKEFCNKYFLKTHKANKHGIYSENQGGSSLVDPIPSLSLTNYFFINNESSFETSPPAVLPTTCCSKSLPLYNPSVYSANRTTTTGTKKSLPLQQPQSSLFSLKSSSNASMRALCNICQREFCNKYFVRRHKLKIHGIVDPVSKDGSLVDPQEIYSLNNNSSQDKIDLSTNEAEIIGTNKKHFMPQIQSTDMKDSIQPLDARLDLPVEKIDKASEMQGCQMSQSAPTSLELSSVFPLPVTQIEENSTESTLSSIKFKKQGVINPEAFCEICCKEYCNKYFLRTHKLKSHGIFPADEKKDDLMNGVASNMPWYQFQTTPLNLIVSDGTNNKDVTEKFCMSSEGEECPCTDCGRYFQNQFLLQMHQAYSHPSKYMTNENVLTYQQNSKRSNTPKSHDVQDNEKIQLTENYLLPVVKKELSKDHDEGENKEVVNSENLKKLQAFILRLNSPNYNERSFCDVCEKDVGHVSLLENHILKEHAALLEELGNITEQENSSSHSPFTSSTYQYKKECPNCQKLFFTPHLLEQHMTEVHNDSEFYNDLETTKVSSEIKDVNNVIKLSPTPLPTQNIEEVQGIQTPTSSFCEICKKELCNKYFMKTHMQRMHGISIENGAQIGGVLCDICNKELCSKYFLRVHKQNSHGIVDELFLPQIGFDFGRNQSPNTDPALKPSDQTDLSSRYFTDFKEVCPICNRRFKTDKWLKAHLWNDHGKEGKEKYTDAFVPSNVDPKSEHFEDNLQEISKCIDIPTLYGNPSNQLTNVVNSIENTENGKGAGPSGERQPSSENGAGNNSVFSMLMNGKDSEAKQYQCSYCSFSTTILAFLFIHERSHMSARNLQSEPDKFSSQCPICFQPLESKEHFYKHIKLHRMSWQQPYFIPGANEENLKIKERKDDSKKDVILSKALASVECIQQEREGPKSDKCSSISDAKCNTKNQADQTSDSTMQCTKCGFFSRSVQLYLDHVNKEHPYLQTDQELPSYLQQMEKALSTLAGNAGIPSVFAVPRMQEKVTMQPFVLENSEYATDANCSIDSKPGKTFLSSLVFLPVKEKLKKTVTASFKLTPT